MAAAHLAAPAVREYVGFPHLQRNLIAWVNASEIAGMTDEQLDAAIGARYGKPLGHGLVGAIMERLTHEHLVYSTELDGHWWPTWAEKLIPVRQRVAYLRHELERRAGVGEEKLGPVRYSTADLQSQYAEALAQLDYLDSLARLAPGRFDHLGSTS